jgi:hypothetical protein
MNPAFAVWSLPAERPAKRFRKWVTSTVLPQIRKTGGYQGPNGYIGLKDDDVAYKRCLLERALIDAQLIAVEMQRIGVHFLQQMTDSPEKGEALVPEPERLSRRCA